MQRRPAIDAHIASVPMFAACSKKELRTISRLMTERAVDAGKVLMREGQLGREFVVVLSGTAVATRRGRRVARFGPGDFFGEIALLDPAARTATVVAESPMELAVVGPREFGPMLDEVPTLDRKVMRGLAQTIRELTRRPLV